MTPFPRIQRQCPYLDRLDTVVDGGFCRMCRRDVHDLTGMDERQRADFVAGCGGDACVSYTVNVKPAVAAALIAASAAVLVAPGAASAKHPASRGYQHHRPRVVEAPLIMVRTAGLPVLVAADPKTEPQHPIHHAPIPADSSADGKPRG